MEFDIASYLMGKTAGGGGESGIPLLTRAEWNALTTAQKQAYNLVAVKDASSGFDRGELYYGADYIPINLIESGYASQSGGTITLQYSGHHKLLVLAINSEATSVSLETTASLNGSPLSGETLETNNFSSSGNNQRNYRLSLFDINYSANDTLKIEVSNYTSYTTTIWAIIDSTVLTLNKSMTTSDGATSGNNRSNGMAVYGTADGRAKTGTISVNAYSADTNITTENPGTDYKSSYIFWVIEATP